MARKSPLRSLFKVFWQAPLMAIPFAVFFGTIFSNGFGGYVFAYRIALVYALVVGLAIWAVANLTAVGRSESSDRNTTIRATLVYTAAAVAASYVGTVLVDLWFFPGSLLTVRNLVMVGMFSLLFAGVFTGISYAMHYHDEALTRARTDEEMKLARRVQESFLLSEIPPRPGFDVHAVNISSREVSGDFYDWVPEGNGTFLVAIADVSGKGFPAALLSSMLQASLRTQAGSVPGVSTILSNLNRLVHRNGGSGQFATFFLARLDERTGTLSYTNAGHNQPVVFRKRGGRELLSEGGLIVGIMETPEYTEGQIRLEPGDRLVLYTDGITEAQKEDGEFFEEERLYEVVERIPPGVSARDATSRILESVTTFLDGADPGDDMTLVVIQALER